MRIIKRGNKKEKAIRGECRHCGCIFEFTKTEAAKKFESSPRGYEDSGWRLKCPQEGCGAEVWVNT